MYDSKSPNVHALNKVYQNSRAAIEAIDCLIPKVKDENMKRDLASQILGHHNLIKSSSAKLHEVHHYPHEPNLFSTAVTTRLKSAVDSSDSHIAEILIENSTAGIINIQRGSGENLTQDVSGISGEAVSFEQANINKLCAYL